jgi:replicative DNA helicase
MVQSSTDLIEKTILACIYAKPKLIEEVFVKEEYFSNTYYRTVFKLSLEFYKNNKKLDIVLIYQQYQNYLTQKFVSFITDIVNTIATTTIFNDYQEKLFEIYKNNLIVKYVDKFKSQELNQEQLFECLDKIKNMVSNQSYEFLSEEEIYHIITKQDRQIHFRLESLSNLIKLTEHDFVVIGARPGVGKTGFALNLLEDISNNYKCLYFNMEMSEQQVLRRLVSINSKVPISNLIRPASEYQENIIKESVKTISNKNLKIFTGIQTTNSIKQQIIKESKQEHIVCFIDYIGLISGQNSKTQYERITCIVKELRQISMNFDCTIIGLAQVNRNGDNAPMLIDLKDSGELEQSAVSVMLLHNENANKEIDKKIEELEVIVAKNRNGRTGIIKVEYNQFNQFIEEKKKY